MKLWILLVIMCGVCNGSRILVFYPGASGSLISSFNYLFQELSRRGHEVTVATSYKLPYASAYNITQILYNYTLPDDFTKLMNERTLVQKIYLYWTGALYSCGNLLEHPKTTELLNSNQTYDLFIGSPFYYIECSVAVAHQLKLPILNIYSNRMQIHFTHLVGHLFPYSYIADFNLPFSHNMSFWQRTVNAVFCLGYSLGLSVYYIPRMDAVVKQHFPHLPPLEEMLEQVHITLLNTNLAVHPAQPLLPGVVPVGGLTIPQNVKLPQELQAWMDASDQGVILFSLGSNIKSSTSLDPAILKVIMAVFSKLSQRVLMKWEMDHIDGKPDNVRLAKWIPQTAVLGHARCKLFITHGGLHSWMEAVHFSVPILGMMDTFLDQTQNLAEIQERGHGLHFTGPWTEDSFYNAVNEVLFNPKYKENIRKASKVFWDQPMSPLETAVYWTEYVMRHNGARHLKSAARSMPWYQVVLLDVVAALALGVFVILLLIYIIFKCGMRCLARLYGWYTFKKRPRRKVKVK